MKKTPTKSGQRKRRSRGIPPLLKWGGLIVAIALIGYSASEMRAKAYGESAIRVVDFSTIDAAAKRSVLR